MWCPRKAAAILTWLRWFTTAITALALCLAPSTAPSSSSVLRRSWSACLRMLSTPVMPSVPSPLSVRARTLACTATADVLSSLSMQATVAALSMRASSAQLSLYSRASTSSSSRWILSPCAAVSSPCTTGRIECSMTLGSSPPTHMPYWRAWSMSVLEHERSTTSPTSSIIRASRPLNALRCPSSTSSAASFSRASRRSSTIGALSRLKSEYTRSKRSSASVSESFSPVLDRGGSGGGETAPPPGVLSVRLLLLVMARRLLKLVLRPKLACRFSSRLPPDPEASPAPRGDPTCCSSGGGWICLALSTAVRRMSTISASGSSGAYSSLLPTSARCIVSSWRVISVSLSVRTASRTAARCIRRS
mmetsp:Transcript_23997/g.75119  ORF Transcript_23997/g.75119 Transcript_23997/m.75119 type:complete len:362 (-) Transcript_23997:4626-5711(-)